jgi:hypothetical protein
MTYMCEFGENLQIWGAPPTRINIFLLWWASFIGPSKKKISQALFSPKLDIYVVISSFGLVR